MHASRRTLDTPRAVDAVRDPDGFDAFVAARGAALVRTARGLLRDPQHAEDVVQEVLVKAHQHWPTIVRAAGPEAYLRRMLVNASISFWRRAARREIAVVREELPLAAVPDLTGQVDQRDLVLALLRRLPPRQRAVLVLRHYEGLSDAEIADALQTSAATVRSNVHRGLASLRRMLDQAGEGLPTPVPARPSRREVLP